MENNYDKEKRIFLENMLADYMKAYSISSIEDFFDKTDEELLNLKEFNIQLVLYVKDLKKESES